MQLLDCHQTDRRGVDVGSAARLIREGAGGFVEASADEPRGRASIAWLAALVPKCT
jgi:hypothetical protein